MCLAFLIVVLATTLIEASFPANQWNALYDLYNSTQGWNWQYPSDVGVWDFSNSSVNPCIAEWQGILCSFNNQTSEYTVWYLDLGNYGLNGFIPDTINQLPNLASLDFSFNSLYNTIPESLYTLSQLVALDLEYNKLNGTISTSISSLKNLSYLLLDNNELTSSIPDGLFDLPLLAINLAFNKLGGKLPKTIGNCSLTLQYLDVSYNQISSSLPDSLYDLQMLIELIINNNNFSGTISERLVNMQMLLAVAGEENNFFGSLPANIFSRDITYIEFAVNLLTGTLPPCTAQINTLSLASNSFHGTVPQSLLDSSTDLLSINIVDNFFNGSVSFASIQLQTAAMNYNLLSGTLPVPNSTSLSDYSLRSNFYTGTVSFELWSRCDYAVVDVSQNYLHGPFYQDNITNAIISLNISYNLLSAGFSLRMWEVNGALNILSLSNNYFFGSFINDWSSFSHLRDLDISSNQFTGDLTASLPLSLQVLSASTNCFRGSFPEEWCGLGNMTNWILNGLSSSSLCQKALFPGTSIKTFVTKYGTTVSYFGVVVSVRE